MLTYFPENIQPDIDALWNGATYNNDGHGYAIVVPDDLRIIIKHSLNAESLIDRFASDRERYPEGPALFHSRIGTSGIMDKFNCHPFLLGGDRNTVVAHNGILPNSMQPSKGDRRCDTHLAAEDIFPKRFGHLRKPKARQRLANAIGTYNKLVILSVNPEYDQWAYIVNEKQGVRDKSGIWYSNYDFEGYKFTATKAYTTTGAWNWDTYDEPRELMAGTVEMSVDDLDCRICHALDSVNEKTQVCAYCHSCADCFMDVNECLCYQGNSIATLKPKPIDDDDDWTYDWNGWEWVAKRESA